jgi:hypothetical protein
MPINPDNDLERGLQAKAGGLARGLVDGLLQRHPGLAKGSRGRRSLCYRSRVSVEFGSSGYTYLSDAIDFRQAINLGALIGIDIVRGQRLNIVFRDY